MLGNSIQIHLQLTNDSLHRRNITHHGITTLRPTICHGLLREGGIETGDIVLDPMTGCGSIPIEGAISCKSNAYFIGSDCWAPAVRYFFTQKFPPTFNDLFQTPVEKCGTPEQVDAGF